jgi:AcrR family transcriptional regulator
MHMKDLVRERNRRGEGTRLRAEILAGAAQLLEDSGSEEAVTLRAIARQVGISAPSIYSHFPDREAIVDAIVDGAFSDFNAAIAEAAFGAASPAAQLRAGCAAYLKFAAERPSQYRLLFERKDLLDGGSRPVPEMRTESFRLMIDRLQDCIDAGTSASDDAHRDCAAIWAALHGFATLHGLLPGFPWPDTDAMLDRIVYGLAQISPHPAD